MCVRDTLSLLGCLQLIEVPMLAVRLDLLFTIREFPANMEEFQPVTTPYCFLVHDSLFFFRGTVLHIHAYVGTSLL